MKESLFKEYLDTFSGCAYYQEFGFKFLWLSMCEFNVILNDKIQFRDVIYSKVEGENVIVRNIMGEAKEFKGYRILEVDVPNTRLVLAELRK